MLVEGPPVAPRRLAIQIKSMTLMMSTFRILDWQSETAARSSGIRESKTPTKLDLKHSDPEVVSRKR